MKKLIIILLLILSQICFAGIDTTQTTSLTGFHTFLRNFVAIAKADGINDAVIHEHLLKARYSLLVIAKDSHQPEFSLSYDDYMRLFVTPNRIQQGKLFYTKHRVLVNQISREYGVQPQYLVAILGVETNYGQTMGTYPVISALATLAYIDRRHEFFKRELLAALHMLQDRQVGENRLLGSWAGAMGQCQFMPDLYMNYAVAYRKSGLANIWYNSADALASTANFFHQQGWIDKEETAVHIRIPVNFPLADIGPDSKKTVLEWQQLGIKNYDNQSSLPNWQGPTMIILASDSTDHAYLVNSNFNVLMRWNASYLYALAVNKLAMDIVHEDKIKPIKFIVPSLSQQPTKTIIIAPQPETLLDRLNFLNIQLSQARQKFLHFFFYPNLVNEIKIISK